MTNRELSEKLGQLASQLELLAGENKELWQISTELYKLSCERYEPPTNPSWEDLKPQSGKKYYDKKGRQLPF